MKQYNFISSFQERGNFISDFSQETIKNEPMFFNCNLDFAYSNGGMITKSFIDGLPLDWKNGNPVLDSRVHMLMEGWYPCIPGYHHDDVPRSTINGQPNYDNPEYQSQHLMGLVNGDICPTLFAIGTLSLPKVENDIVYKVWHPMVEQQIIDGDVIVKQAKSGTYIEFDCYSMHSGQKAVANGWRWFVRLSRNTYRQNNMTNEIRRQVQVYLEYPMQGW